MSKANAQKRSIEANLNDISLNEDEEEAHSNPPDEKKTKLDETRENEKPKKSMPLRNLSFKAHSTFKSPLLNRTTNLNLTSNKPDESPIVATTPIKSKTTSTTVTAKMMSTSKATPKFSRKPKTNEELESEIRGLEERINEIDKEIDEFEKQGYAINELDVIIDKLHIFNEIKDIAQAVMGKIAELKCVTIKEVHKDYNADLNDSS